MKKLVLMLAVVFSASLFSCGSSDKAAANNDSIVADTTEVVEVAVATDSCCADSAACDSVPAV